MTNFLRSPNTFRGLFTRATMVGALALGTLSGCGQTHPKPPIDYSDPSLILAGKAPWGDVNLKIDGPDCVAGELAWGKVDVCKVDNRVEGESPWGHVDVKVDDGHVTGKLPWGDVDVTIDTSGVNGELPWGDVDLDLSGDRLQGKMPWGDANLRFGASIESISSPLAVTALVALMSDKT